MRTILLPIFLAGLVTTVASPLMRSLSGRTLSADRGIETATFAESTTEGQRPDPVDFTPEELQELHRRFGVHGPQPRLAQLFTTGIDQLQQRLLALGVSRC